MTAHARLAASAALLVSSMAAHAVVESGHWSVATNTAVTGTNVSIAIDQTVGGDGTGTFWNYDAKAGTLRLVTLNTDEGSVLFWVKPGDIVSQDMVLAPGAHSLGGNTGPGVVVGKDFYLGAATSSFSDPGFSWATYTNRTTFGWAHFQLQADGGLKILDSAMAFREPGIKVGTLQAIPEPGTWALMGLGLLALVAVSSKRHATV